MSKDPLFRTCDIMMLRRMQIQDADDEVSNPTDLDEKPVCNRFNIIPETQTSFSSGGAQQSEETALHEAKVFRCSVDGTSIDLRITISTGRDLGHEDWFISPLLTSLSNTA